MKKVEYRNSFRITNERIKTLLIDRLSIMGTVRTDDAWQLCRKEFSYGVVAFHFKIIMNQMKEDASATAIANGNWLIHKKGIMIPGKRFTDQDLDYIYDNRLKLTTDLIAEHLKVPEEKIVMTCIENHWRYRTGTEGLKIPVRRPVFAKEEEPEPDPPKKLVRAKAEYNNTGSPYGIADELHKIKNY